MIALNTLFQILHQISVLILSLPIKKVKQMISEKKNAENMENHPLVVPE